MSKETYTRCDMCHELIIEGQGKDKNQGTFVRDGWYPEDVVFDLCSECADKVQKFINSNGKEKK